MEVQWCRHNILCSLLATPTFVIIFRWLLVHGSHALFHMCICTKSDLLKACIEPRPLINCCCRPQECHPCSMSALHWIAAKRNTCIRPVQSHSHLFEAHPGACKLTGATYSTNNTPTNLLLYLLVITGICIATYLQYTTSTNSNGCLGFSYASQIWVWPILLSGWLGQQLWSSFNTVSHIPLQKKE